MPEAKTDGLRGRWRLVDGPEALKISDERISEVSERIVRFVSISASVIAPCYTPLPTAPRARRYLLTVTALPYRGWAWPTPHKRGPRKPRSRRRVPPATTTPSASPYGATLARAPGILGKAAPGHSGSLHRRRAARRGAGIPILFGGGSCE